MVKPQVVVLGPAEGDVIVSTPAVVQRWKAHPEDTGGAYEALEIFAHPGRRVPRHVHRDCEEAFYVLEGEKTFEIGDRTVRAAAGSFVVVPRGVPHAHSNEVAARWLVIFSPPGMGAYFEERAALAARAEGGGRNEADLDREQHGGLAARHGMEFLPEEGAS